MSDVPHAFVATWTTDATPAAAYGTQLRDPAGPGAPEGIRLTFHRRMARREDRQRLRFLPLHLALEGYLALQFGGPPIAWQEWTRQAVTRGLSPRTEASYTGAAVAGLDDALRPTLLRDFYGELLFQYAHLYPTAPDLTARLDDTRITDDAGRLAYLKTFRLSAAQARRGHLLSRLAAHDWNLDATAAALKTDRQGLTLRLDRAGFGHLRRPT